jgi:hypothetical protein
MILGAFLFLRVSLTLFLSVSVARSRFQQGHALG